MLFYIKNRVILDEFLIFLRIRIFYVLNADIPALFYTDFPFVDNLFITCAIEKSPCRLRCIFIVHWSESR